MSDEYKCLSCKHFKMSANGTRGYPIGECKAPIPWFIYDEMGLLNSREEIDSLRNIDPHYVKECQAYTPED